MKCYCSVALAGSLALSVSALHAAPGDATRLEYARSQRAAHCPSRETLASAVRTRLGYDPFFPAARQTIVVEITDAEDGSLQAQMHLVDDAGMIVGSRELHDGADHCDELVASLALAISIALDPSAALREGPAALATESSPSATSENSEAPVAGNDAAPEQPAPRDSARIKPPAARAVTANSEPFLRAETFRSLGSSPSAAFGLRLGGGVGLGSFRLLGELSAQLPSSRSGPNGGRVESWSYLGTVAPCLSARAFAACALLQLGSLRSRGRDVPDPAHEASLYGALGARAEYLPRLTGTLHLLLSADLLKTFTPLTLRLRGDSVWQTPFVSFNAGAGFELRFP